MTRNLLLAFVLMSVGLMFVAAAAAPADEIYLPDNVPTAGRGNVIPFGGQWPSTNTNGEFTYQWFIPANLLGGKGFRITGIANAPAKTGVHSATLGQILISHNTLTAPSATFAANLPNPSTLLRPGPWTWNVTAGTWCPFTLDSGAGFNYNGTDNLCLEIRLNGSVCSVAGSATLDCWNESNANCPTRVYSYGVGSFNATTGSVGTNYSGKLRLTVSYISLVGSGAPNPGGTVNLDLASSADAGLPYQIGTSLGTGPIPIDTRKLDLSPDDLLRVSTSGLLPMIFAKYAGNLDATGAASAAIVIPNNTAFIGVRLHTAFLTLKAGAPSNVSSISPTYTFTVMK